jgi:hypothetical protein
VGVQHDGAVVDITVLLEETRNIGLSQTGVNASDEEVGAGVDGALILFLNGLAGNRSSVGVD